MLKDYARGLQHIGIPTEQWEETLRFYESLGFEEAHRNRCPGGERVAFLSRDGLTLEIYEGARGNPSGAVNHFALEVSDVEAAYRDALAEGFGITGPVDGLPFWERGVRFFIIKGPNGENVEFCQRL